LTRTHFIHTHYTGRKEAASEHQTRNLQSRIKCVKANTNFVYNKHCDIMSLKNKACNNPNKLNLSLLHYAEACNELAGPISATRLAAPTRQLSYCEDLSVKII